MFCLFKRPIKKATIDAWAKILEDLAKFAVLGIVALLYSPEKGIHFDNVSTALLLLLLAYLILCVAKGLRDDEDWLSKND